VAERPSLKVTGTSRWARDFRQESERPKKHYRRAIGRGQVAQGKRSTIREALDGLNEVEDLGLSLSKKINLRKMTDSFYRLRKVKKAHTGGGGRQSKIRMATPDKYNQTG